MRDVVAMGARPVFLLDFIGTRPLDQEVIKAIKSKTDNVAVIGEVTSDDKEIFEYNGEVIATIPNTPSKETIELLRRGN